MLRQRRRFLADDEDDPAEGADLAVKPATIHHCSLSEGKSAAPNYDIVLCARNFANMFADAQKKGTVVLGLKNIMSAPEMEQAMKDAGLLD